MADFLTLADIYGAIGRATKKFKATQTTLIKEVANMAYFTMLSADDLYPIFWLRDLDDTLYALAPMTITAITKANLAVASVTNTLTEGDIISVYNVVGMTEVNNRVFKVGSAAQGLDTSNVPLLDLDGTAINSSAFTTYTSGGNMVHRGLTLATTGKNVEKILSCSFHGYNGSLTEITPKELEESTKWWDDNASRPQRYLHRKAYTSAGAEANQLLWFPGSDAAYDLRYWLEKRISPLSADADVPLMPPRFHYGIIAGGITKLIEMKVQVENAVIWPSIYKAIIEEMLTYNRKFYQDNDAIDRERPFLL